jgi:hypothetical protein
LESPKHRLCRAVRTVEALWREWTVGLQGHPSIEVLDRKWGNHWRAGRQSELQWYSLRLEVIREIRRLAQAQGTGEDAAMWQVSLYSSSRPGALWTSSVSCSGLAGRPGVSRKGPGLED